MEFAMCERVQAADYQITVYARTPSKITGLCEKGAIFVDSPMAVGERRDVVFTMVSNPYDVREFVLGTKGILSGMAPGNGTVLVDMTSIHPSLAREYTKKPELKTANPWTHRCRAQTRGLRTVLWLSWRGVVLRLWRSWNPCLGLWDQRLIWGLRAQARAAR